MILVIVVSLEHIGMTARVQLGILDGTVYNWLSILNGGEYVSLIGGLALLESPQSTGMKAQQSFESSFLIRKHFHLKHHST